jgi:hypothetical protein
MKRIIVFIATILIVLGASSVFGKKKFPELAKPILYNGIIYQADQNYKDIGGYYENMGKIKAIDSKTKKELWKKQIYKIQLSDNMERDVQMVFITNIMIDSIHNGLIIINEKDNKYFVNISTQESYQIIEYK